jgi:hypothetical protein
LIIKNNNIITTKQHYEIEYPDLFNKFEYMVNTKKYHYGIPLGWNNIIRREGMSHLHINNFTQTNLEKMFLKIMSKIILKHINKFKSKPILKYNVKMIDFNETNLNVDNNVIIVNAWNEWNEQAVLEPTNVDGYSNLEIICQVKKI